LKRTIPFNKPYTGQAEADAIQKVLRSGILRGDGPHGKRIQTQFREDTGARHAFFTTSCTHALEIAISTLDLQAGDEVIMPSFTFVSTANAVILHGAKPVFADILEDSLNLDPADVARKVTSKTKAIIPVHYAGVAAPMSELLKIASSNGLKIIEDAAQGADSWYNRQHLGTIGTLGCISFHDTKNITCGEGGMLLTNDDKLASSIEIIREKGTNRSAFLRGEVDKYTWIGKGSSYIQSDILAAVLEVQWQKKSEIKKLRKRVWDGYHKVLKPFEQAKWLRCNPEVNFENTNYHTYFFCTRRIQDRDVLLTELKSNGIMATFHYVPLHSSPFGMNFHDQTIELPVTDRISNSIIRLPIFPELDIEYPDYSERVYNVLMKYFTKPSVAEG
jgi:dTDP-4-amino-4,6-dideoxygalactose transaminase